MGRDDDVGLVPPRAVGRQRLLDENVEHRAGKPATAERLEQRRLVDERAARTLISHACEGSAVDDRRTERSRATRR